MPFTRWPDKQTVAYPHNVILFSTKTNELTSHKKNVWMNLKCIVK